MTLDALRLEVPDILETEVAPLADLNEQLTQARLESPELALQQTLGLLFRLNRSAMTLLERQRALQSFSDQYRHYSKGWSEVAMYFWLTSAPADFESGKSIKNDQITHSFLCF